MAIFNNLKNIKSIRHDNKEIVAVYVNDKFVYQKDIDDGYPTYNYFVFNTAYVAGTTTVVLQNYRAGDTTEWDGLTDWGDGTVDTALSHTYATDGVYTVTTKYLLNHNNSYDYNTVKMLMECNGLNKNITNMSHLFYSCSNLTYVDSSKIKTNKVTDMNNMFFYCKSLTSLDLSNWNTSRVTAMNNMFSQCNNLKSVNLSGWNTSNVTNMGTMFGYCYKLTSLELSHFNTSNVNDMSFMFYGCESLTNIDLSSFNTSKLTIMSYMFATCYNLAYLNVSNWNTDKVTSYNKVFTRCDKLKLYNITMTNCNETTVAKITEAFNNK